MEFPQKNILNFVEKRNIAGIQRRMESFKPKDLMWLVFKSFYIYYADCKVQVT